jgi:hypothetical protein
MVEGWSGDDHIILFDEVEVADATQRYSIREFLPGFQVVGLHGWDDFIVRDDSGRSYSVPTVPLDLLYLRPFVIPEKQNLVKDERFEGKIKWYIMPIVFGGDPAVDSNLEFVNHEQHTGLVRWWNDLYRSVRNKPDRPM